MDMLFTVSVLAIVGLVFGSFAGAQVWRLRARQLKADKQAGEVIPKREYTRLQGLVRPLSDDRSMCLHCHHELRWYDLIPLFSWLSLGGKCRYCKHRIGGLEPLTEIGMATLFVVSFIFWPSTLANPLDWARFVIWLIACILMTILFVYDAKWSLLPFGVNVGLVVTGVVFLVLTIAMTPFAPQEWLSLLGGIMLLAGLYYVFSIPGWVGLGDSILGLGLTLFLIGWEKAFLTLFFANLLGCFMLIPLALKRVPLRGAHIPFGPFLIVGAIVSFLWGPLIIATIFDWSNVLLNPLMV